MADKEKNSESQETSKTTGSSSGGARRIGDSERFRYIGFEVFPGKPKDLFKSDAERDQIVERMKERRKKGETTREHNTLLEERVSFGERIVLAVACLIMLGSLFLPWYSAYTEVVSESAQPVEESAVMTPEADSLALALAAEALGQQPAAGADTAAAAAPVQEASSSEEVIHGAVARKRVVKETTTLNWFGALGALGAVGKYLFSSGVLAVSAILMLLYQVLVLVLPLLTLYLLFGVKEKGDQLALKLKRTLKFNWAPVILFLAVFILSFFGGEYSFDAASMFDSLGTSYGIAAFANAVSWGAFVSLAMFIMIAAKSIEI